MTIEIEFDTEMEVAADEAIEALTKECQTPLELRLAVSIGLEAVKHARELSKEENRIREAGQEPQEPDDDIPF